MRVYLGEMSALLYIGKKTKEFTRANFLPKPIVGNGDIIILDKLAAYNLAKLLPLEWELLEKEYIQVDNDFTLKEKIVELEDYVSELEEAIAEHGLEEIQEESDSLNISYEEALDTSTPIKAFEEFSSKEELEEYALKFGLELNTRMSLKKMYDIFLDFVSKDD